MLRGGSRQPFVWAAQATVNVCHLPSDFSYHPFQLPGRGVF